MTARHVASMPGGQDGAIYGDYLFRFKGSGLGSVYSLEKIKKQSAEPIVLSPISSFTLDRAEEIVPHSNAVVFGNEFYAEGDEFLLIYSNVYNNYKKADDQRVGVCCVYRIQRNGTQFSSTLVQLIKIGFTDDRTYWRSAGEVADVRPYGNFVIDVEKSLYYAFVMRDADNTTRYFAFDLPRLSDGEVGELGIKTVTLGTEDIKEYFDVPYHNYVQGAYMRDGKIYSTEGFGEKIHPAIRIIDTEAREQIFFCDLFDLDMKHEAEFIDFYNGSVHYSDARGNLFKLNFENL